MGGEKVTKVIIPQYEREIGAAQESLSTELSTGFVDKETPGSELEFGTPAPTILATQRVSPGIVTFTLRAGQESFRTA